MKGERGGSEGGVGGRGTPDINRVMLSSRLVGKYVLIMK